MRHRKKGKKFNRNKEQRKALMKSLAESLIIKNKIKTTETKAKELKRFIEHKITKAKNQNIASRRLLKKYFSDKSVKKLVEDIAPRLKARKGGYTRITKVNEKKTNGAKMAIIEIIE